MEYIYKGTNINVTKNRIENSKYDGILTIQTKESWIEYNKISGTKNGICLNDSTNIAAYKDIILNSGKGIFLTGTSYSHINSNYIENNYYGIYLSHSNLNFIINNILRNNHECIYHGDNSGGNQIKNNDCGGIGYLMGPILTIVFICILITTITIFIIHIIRRRL